MSKLVKILIDGKEYELPAGYNLLKWGNDNGMKIPFFCAHRKLAPWGACRMCVVKMGSRVFDKENNVYTGEIRWMPKLQISCAIDVAEGQAFLFDCPEVHSTRKSQVELHLINHPLECPVCDKGGECQLQDWSYVYGSGEGRFVEAKREEPDFEINEFVQLNYKRCIICKRCVRFHHEIAQDYLVEFKERGYHTELFSFPIEIGSAQSKFAGNSIDICPVGAITSKAFHYRARIWELEHTDSIDPFDSAGTNISVHHYKNIFARITPRDTWGGFSKAGGTGGNPEVDFGWCTDKVRFSQDYAYNENRATQAMVNQKPVSVSSAVKHVSELINQVGVENVGILAGSLLTNEEYIELLKFIDVKEIKHYYFGDPLEFSSNDNYSLTGLFKHLGSVDQVCNANTVFVIGCDLIEEAGAQGLFLERIRRENPANQLFSLNPVPTEIDRHATACFQYKYGDEWAVINKLQAILEEKDSEFTEEFRQQLSTDKTCAIVIGKGITNAVNANLIIASITDLVEKFNKKFCTTYLNVILDYGNSAGALLLGRANQIVKNNSLINITPPKYSDFLQLCSKGEIKLLITLGCDLVEESPYKSIAAQALNGVQHKVVLNLFKPLDSIKADVFIPGVTFMEKEGTWISSFGRLQQLHASNIPNGDGISEFHFIRLLRMYLRVNGKVVQPIEDYQLLSSIIKKLPDYPVTRNGVQIQIDCSSSALPNTKFETSTSSEIVVIPRRVLYDQIPMVNNSELFKSAIREPECWMSREQVDKLQLKNRDWIELDFGLIKYQARLKIKHSMNTGFIALPDRVLDCDLAVIREPNKLITVKKITKLQDASVFKPHLHKVES